MDIFVFDKNYKALGIMDSPISLSYIVRFKTKGEFLLTMPLSSYNEETFATDNYLLFDEEMGIAGVISSWNKVQDEDGNMKIKIKGGLCDTYLYRRIVWGQYVKSGTSIDIAEDLVRTQIISPTDDARAIKDLEIVSVLSGKGEQIEYQNTGGVVGEEIEQLCSADDFGFTVKFDREGKRMVFSVLEGTDRTEDQDVVVPCVFSQEYEDILSSSYEENYSTYKNVALVSSTKSGSSGEQTTKFVTVQNDASIQGKDRIETFVQASGLSSKDGDRDIPDAEYEEMMKQKGREQLDTLRPVVNFDCVINTLGSKVYGKDYFLGDKVTIMDTDINRKLNAEISEVETVYDSNGKSIYITFGYNQLTLAKAIKAKVVS